MLEVKLPVELPTIDLGSVLPLIALVVLAALILITLMARSLIQSKALAIVALAAILIGGSASIVGGLQATAGLIGVSGAVAIGLIVTLSRHQAVLDVVRTLAEKQTRTLPPITGQQSSIMIDAQRPPATYQLPAVGQTGAPRRHAARRSARVPRGLGF
jgi:hypothetical protein